MSTTTATSNPKPGSWIYIHAKVVDEPTHPDDVMVELWSHSDQYRCHVRRSIIAKVVTPPWPPEPGNGAAAIVNQTAWQRCGHEWSAAGNKSVTWEQLVHQAWNAGQDEPVVVWEP